jgi:cell shape-determining protein MreC
MRTKSPLDKRTWITFALLVALWFWGGSIYGGVSHSISSLVYPLVVWGNSVTNGFLGLSDYLIFKNNLINENNRLREENNRLRAAAIARDDLEKEVDKLREVMGKRSTKDSWLLAKVISNPAQTVNDVLLLDIGQKSVAVGSIKIGDKVILSNNLILGEITEIGRYYSKMQLYSAAGEKINVLVGASGTPAVAVGQGSGNFSIVLPRGLDIPAGSKIYYASSTKRYTLGLVSAMKKRANNPFQTLYFRYPINLNDLDFVEIHHDD